MTAAASLPEAITVVMADVCATYPLPVRLDRVVVPGSSRPSSRSRSSADEFWISAGDPSAVGIRVDQTSPLAEQIADVADQVADWLVESLPGAGHPAVWPRCPLHPDSHPMRAQVVAAVAVWTCPHTGDAIAAVGALG